MPATFLPQIDALLFVLVTGVVALALAIDVVVVVAWMRRKKP